MSAMLVAVFSVVLSVVVGSPFFMSPSVGTPFFTSGSDTQGTVNDLHGLQCQDRNEVACSLLEVNARCETSCEGYRVCFKACPSGATAPGANHLLCICRNGFVRSSDNTCVPYQSCITQPNQLFNTPSSFQQFNTPSPFQRFNTPSPFQQFNTPSPFQQFSTPSSFQNNFGSLSNRRFGGAGDQMRFNGQMPSMFEMPRFDAASEQEHQNVEPQDPFETDRKRRALLLAKRQKRV